MSNPEPHLQVARKLRSVETVRVEMVQQVAEVFRSIQTANQRDLAQSIGGLVGLSYYLAALMGIEPDMIDGSVLQGFPRTLLESGLENHDLEMILRHVGTKR